MDSFVYKTMLCCNSMNTSGIQKLFPGSMLAALSFSYSYYTTKVSLLLSFHQHEFTKSRKYMLIIELLKIGNKISVTLVFLCMIIR